MKSTVLPLILLGVAISAASFGQQPAAPAPTDAPSTTTTQSSTTPSAPAPSTSTPTSNSSTAAAATNPTAGAAKPDAPSADTLKKAKANGYYTRVRQGKTFFCKKEARLGTRFETENCMSEQQLVMTLERNQQQRDQMNSINCAGSGCGGGK